MKAESYYTPHEIAVEGFKTLARNLGVSAALRFILQYERGEGDYTRERRHLLKGLTIESLQRTKRSRVQAT